MIYKTILFGNVGKVPCLQCFVKRFASQSISKVGFIGLGAMGSHMARNLLKKYKEVYVFDVNQSAVASLVQDGATAVPRLEDLSTADCIVSMLPASKHVLDVYHGQSGLISKVSSGTLIIDSSTIEPQVSQQLAAEAKQRNVTFLDAPVSGGIMAAASGSLTFMVGGTEEGVKRSEDVLRSMGKNTVHCGSSGSGQVFKLCNNVLLAITMTATAEAMNLGIKLGMDPKLLASVFNSSTGRCWSSDTYNPVPGVLPAVPSSNNYQGGFAVRLMVKDLSLAQGVAEHNAIPTPFGKQALQIYKTIYDQGKADLDFSVVYQYIKNLSNKQS